MNHRAAIVYDPKYSDYDLGPEHPLRPLRLETGLSLLRMAGIWSGAGAELLPPIPATVDELALVHSADYIAAIQMLSTAMGETFPLDQLDAGRFGMGTADNPIFPGIHEICALISGGTLLAARRIMNGELDHAFNPGGGLHHALRDRASGFCIYNDAAIAIAALAREHEAKILYLDFDAHHGDGVQWLFYDDSRVLTVSFHETGRYLFPGTGDVYELGEGIGRGYSVNVPVDAFTEDESWIAALEAIVPGLVERFHPDIIISNHGCDTHTWDPLTHLALTTRSLAAQAALTHRLAHEHCQGRWLALGGGGYDIYRVLPRSYALLWAEMTGATLPEQLPTEWRERWREDAVDGLPLTYLDAAGAFTPKPRRAEIEQQNRRIVGIARELFLPPRLRQAYSHAAVQASRRNFLSLTQELARLGEDAAEPRSQSLVLPGGPVYLRAWTPPSLVQRMTVDSGLRAFARTPERERDLFVTIAGHHDTSLTIAHTPQGSIIGQVTLAPPDDWWGNIPGFYEIAIEVSSNWRQQGLAQALLHFTLVPPAFDSLILMALGYSWHWDVESTGLSVFAYRDMLRKTFAPLGFVEMRTNEPNIMDSSANILLVRIGKTVPPDHEKLFRSRLIRPRNVHTDLWR